MKVLYLAIFGIILLLVFIVNGCSYPTSYKAFIPKALDSDYKEYQRLCKEEIGKVIYARVQQGITMSNIDEQSFMWFLPSKKIVPQVVVLSNLKTKQVFYIKIVGFYYYTSWNKFYPELFIMPHNEKDYLYEGYNLQKNATILTAIKQEAINNDTNIGENFDDAQGFNSYNQYILNILFGDNQ